MRTHAQCAHAPRASRAQKQTRATRESAEPFPRRVRRNPSQRPAARECMHACMRADPRLPGAGPRLQRASRGGPASCAPPCPPPHDWRRTASRRGANACRRSARSAIKGAHGPGRNQSSLIWACATCAVRHDRFSQRIFLHTKNQNVAVLNLRTFMPSCAHCAASLVDHGDPAFGLCAGCNRARYCCSECQRAAWCGCSRCYDQLKCLERCTRDTHPCY